MTNSIHITSGINNQTLFTVKTSKSFDVNYYKKIIDGLQIGLTFKSEKQDSINTKLYIKNIPYFNKFIFKDLCLNENDFRAFLTINEFGKASSHHKTENLLVYFNDLHSKKYPSFRFSLSISPKKNDLIISINDKWKNFTTARLDDFKNHIIRLLNLYYEKAPEIEKKYKEFIPSFKITQFSKTQKLQSLEGNKGLIWLDIDGYSRIVAPQFRPKTIEENQIENWIKENQKFYPTAFQNKLDEIAILKFPKPGTIDPETNNQIPPKFFVCPDPSTKIKFISLKPTPNGKKFAYTPICKENLENALKLREQYFTGDKKVSKSTGSYSKKLDKPLLDAITSGKLPEQLHPFLSGGLLRKGTYATPNSLIECMEKAISDQTSVFHLSISNPKAYKEEVRKTNINSHVGEKRNTLISASASLEYIGLCAQNANGNSLEELKQILKSNEFIDPRIFLRYFEFIYKCNIILFDSNGFCFPYFKNGFFESRKIFDKTVLLYYIFDENSKNWLCELIYNKESPENFFFKTDSKFIENILKNYYANIKFFELNSEISVNKTDLKYNFILNLNPVSQVCDTFGKTRILILEVGSQKNTICLLTSPMPNFPIKHSTLTDIRSKIGNASEDTVKSFISHFGFNQTENTVNNAFIKTGIQIEKDGMVFHIINSQLTQNIQQGESSLITEFNKNKKAANCLAFYIQYAFSKFLQKEASGTLTEEIIKNFISQNLKQKPAHFYGELIDEIKGNPSMYNFSENHIYILGENYEETRKRLINLLISSIKTNFGKIKELHQKTNFPDFFQGLSDFEVRPGTTIIEFEQWINQNGEFYIKPSKCHKLIKNLPYTQDNVFFYDDKGNITLAQNNESIYNALDVSLKWNRYNFNPMYKSDSYYDDDELPDIFWSLDDNGKISEIKEAGHENNMKIIGYKNAENQSEQFISLLKL